LPAKVYKGAAALEMLHVATLVHDDIVDEAPLRRGLPSVVAGRGVKTAVLVGDLQFVQALRGFAAAVNCESDMQLVRRVLDAAFDVCRGELDELDRTLPDDPQLRFERYICTIDRKTGALFRLACSAGVELAGGRTRDARRAGFFGRSLGRAFQIIDDIRDIIEFELYAGKEAAVDLMRGRHSLPLLFAVDAMGTHCTIARALRGEEGVCEDALVDALDALRDCGAIDRAYAEARRQALEALFYLDFFPPGPARDELRALTLEIVDRPVNR
jgi:heptaprenyl diphosphate synthase